MTTIGKAAARLGISPVPVGDDLTLTFTVTENGSPYVWSGATITKGIFRDGVLLSTNWTVTNTVDGTLLLALTDTNTTALGPGSFDYFVSVTKAGATDTWLAGKLKLSEARQSSGSSTASATLAITTAAAVNLAITGGAIPATAAQVLALLVTVDGAGSLLDADKLDGVEGAVYAAATAQVATDLAAHLADTSDAHDASAISLLDTAGNWTATDVEGALAEIPSRYSTVINHGAVAGTARVGTAACLWIGSVDPTNATNNDTLYRTDLARWYVRVAGAWVDVTAAAQAAAATDATAKVLTETTARAAADALLTPLGSRSMSDRVLSAPVITAGKVLDTATYDGFGVATECRNGDIAYIYRSSTAHTVPPGDYCPIKMIRSTDGGATVGSPSVVLQVAGEALVNYCIGTTPTGRIVVIYTRQNPDTGVWLGLKVIYSDDNGTTWSTPAAVVTPSVATFSAYGHIIAIDGGRLLASYYGNNGTNAYSYVVFSDDNGVTWSGQVTALAGLVATTYYNETCFAYVGGRKILGLVRTDGTKGGYRQILSTDNGATWTLVGAVTFDAHANAGTAPAWLSVVVSPDGERYVECTYLNFSDSVLESILAPLDGPSGNTVTHPTLGHLTWLTVTNEQLGFSASYPSVVRFNGAPWGIVFACNEISASDRDIYYANHRALMFQNKIFTRGAIVPTGGSQAITGSLTATGPLTAQLGTVTEVAIGNMGSSRPGLLFNNSRFWVCASGSPEGVFAAPVGSMWTRTDGGANTTLYIKESGTGNTGWVAK